MGSRWGRMLATGAIVTVMLGSLAAPASAAPVTEWCGTFTTPKGRKATGCRTWEPTGGGYYRGRYWWFGVTLSVVPQNNSDGLVNLGNTSYRHTKKARQRLCDAGGGCSGWR